MATAQPTVDAHSVPAALVGLGNDAPGRPRGGTQGNPVGTFGINLYVPDIGSPWGGRGISGQGVAYGPEGMDAYLTTKSVFLPPPRPTSGNQR